jgi:deazaflavin-dependent oxidoreductase (nitroreductase family)
VPKGRQLLTRATSASRKQIAVRTPSGLYRARLGFMLRERYLVLGHIGRRSGLPHRTLVQVLEHDLSTGEYIVCSVNGPTASWYLDLLAASARSVTVGNRTWRPAQRLLDPYEVAERFAQYQREQPGPADAVLRAAGLLAEPTEHSRQQLAAHLPMVAFSDHPGEWP